jgi:7-cyano-7-deazaguanine synthase
MKVLSICSGGLDSVSFASTFIKKDVTLMTFNYGQKAQRECDVVEELGEIINAGVIKINVGFMKKMYGNSNQLTSDDQDIENEYAPSVVVPLRNALFLQIAMIYAYTHKYDTILLGSHQNDIQEIDGERLYPDCSPEFFKAFELAMDLGTFRKDKRVQIITPSILNLGKSDLIREGYTNLGPFIYKTWSCYHTRMEHCGVCESCRNRKIAFEVAGIPDATSYEK